MAGSRYYLRRGDTEYGPFSSRDLRDLAESGRVLPTDHVRKEGIEKWVAADSVKGLFTPASPPANIREQVGIRLTKLGVDFAKPEWLQPPDVGTESPISPPGSSAIPSPQVEQLSSGVDASPMRPWNPVAIAWLGLIFSPVWAGLMAALNGRRMGLAFPFWRPISVGVGSLLVALLLGIWLDSYVLDLSLYLGALLLLWFLDLKPQSERYLVENQTHGKWLAPTLAGSPVAVLVFLVFIVAPFIPLEPREVCEKFCQANTVKELKKHSTINLWPAIESPMFQPDGKRGGDGENFHFELTDEAPAPQEVGGYLVGYRMVQTKEGHQREGLFHLVVRGGEWKVEDVYLVSIDRQPLERWPALSTDYALFLAPSPESPPVVPSPPSTKQPPVGSEKSWWDDAKNRKLAGDVASQVAGEGAKSFFNSGAGKSAGKMAMAVVAAVAVGIGVFAKRIFSGIEEGVKAGAAAYNDHMSTNEARS